MCPKAKWTSLRGLVVAFVLAGSWACGAASELEHELQPGDDAAPTEDATPDARPDSSPVDAPTDTNPPDAYDGGPETAPDGNPYDVFPPMDGPPPDDGFPPYDTFPPPYDAPPYDGFPPPYDGYPPPYDSPPYDAPPPYDGPDGYPYDYYFFDYTPPPDVDAGPPWEGGVPTAIATGENPVALTADDTNVYWINSGGTVLDCPVSGCPGNVPNLLALNGVGYGYSQNLAVSGLTAYYLDTSSHVDDCAAGGCGLSPTTFASGATDAYAFGYAYLRSDSANVYYADGSGVFQCPALATCSSPVTLASSSSFSFMGPLALSATEVYYGNGDFSAPSLLAVAIGGGSPRTVCTPSGSYWSLNSLVYGGGYVYFTNAYDPYSIYECPAGGGGTPTVYWTDVAPTGLATDGTSVFWTNYTTSGDVGTCPVGATCTSPHTVATGQNYPNPIAVNSSAVFWGTQTALYGALK